VGLLIIAIVSFWDDVRPLPPRIRMLVQAVAVALMVIPLGTEWWIVDCGLGDGIDYRYLETLFGRMRLGWRLVCDSRRS
jgi:hypothetical protein